MQSHEEGGASGAATIASVTTTTAGAAACAWTDAIAFTRDKSPASFDQWFSGVQFDGLIDGVLSMNDKKTNEIGGKLIEGRRPVDEAALADPKRDLSDLIPTPAS